MINFYYAEPDDWTGVPVKTKSVPVAFINPGSGNGAKQAKKMGVGQISPVDTLRPDLYSEVTITPRPLVVGQVFGTAPCGEDKASDLDRPLPSEPSDIVAPLRVRAKMVRST